MKPGSKLYPVENARTRAYGMLGLRKGTSFTVDPRTGRTIEILQVTTRKPTTSTRFTRTPREYKPQMKSDPFADIVGKPVNKVGRTQEIRRPHDRPGRFAPVLGRDMFRTYAPERSINAARETRGDSNPFRNDGPRQPVRDVTGIRNAPEASRGTRGRRGDYTGRGDTRRSPTRLPVPERPGEINRPHQFTQITETRFIRKQKESKLIRNKVKSGSWDTYSYSEFLTNMPVNEFLGW